MRIIGVLDLRRGRAVHARAGARDRYELARPRAVQLDKPGDPVGLLRFYVDALGLGEIYVADLDAIVDGRPQESLIRSLTSLGGRLWLDAGIRSMDDARRARDLGVDRIIVGLETLPSFTHLEAICSAAGEVVFSLDTREGVPLVMAGGAIGAHESIETIARRAFNAGSATMVVLDLARVGTGRGVDLEVIDRLRTHVPGADLIAGGGVRGWEDLVRLAGAGCSGALIATALHDGTLGTAHITTARSL
jgi:phosphoribosylformimino-5-aminoimidazole carboxamide ribotide isomerase